MSRRNPAVVIWVLVALLAGTCGFVGMRNYASAQAPLGQPLPEVPQLIDVIPREEWERSSFNERRLCPWQLEFLAPQPDGAPPHRFPMETAIGYTLWHPTGSQTNPLLPEEAVEHNRLAEVDVLFDQPVKYIVHSMPDRREAETVTEYTARYRHKLKQDGAEFYPDVEPLVVPDYRFEHFEYALPDEDGVTWYHYVFLGPMGPKILVIDYYAFPDHTDLAWPWVLKVMESFTPGDELLKAARYYEYDQRYLGWEPASGNTMESGSDGMD
jgi:hypothetical protein